MRKPDLVRRRYLLVAAGLAATFIICFALVSLLDRLSETRAAPALELLEPLPLDYRIVADHTFPAGGNGSGRRRLLVIRTTHTDETEASAIFTSLLRERGWSTAGGDGALSPDGEICVGLDSPQRYLSDPLRGQDQKAIVQQTTGSTPGTYLVVSMLRC